jgi:ferrous iron transport protein A
MPTKEISLADLEIGETAVIQEFKDEFMALKLMEMGCLPNSPITMCMVAPFGDPICVKVCDYCLSLRKAEAKTVIVKNLQALKK